MPTAKTESKTDIWEALRKPFPKEAIGKVNKGFGDIDFVGHAAVTDRLNSVDPTWTWEPMGVTEYGTPYVDEKGGLWIKLTVGGVTRIGYGDNDGKTGPNSIKVAIGDAIKNAAMRFGVALDLWSKDELESHLNHPELKNERPTPIDLEPPEDLPIRQVEYEPLSDKHKAELVDIAKGKGAKTKQEAVDILNTITMSSNFTKTPDVEFPRIRKALLETKVAADA